MSQKTLNMIAFFSLIITLLALFRDVFDVKFSIDAITNSFKNNLPLTSLIMLIIGVLLGPKIQTLLLVKKISQNIDVYDLETASDRLNFSTALQKSYQSAKEEVVITGRGFQKDDDTAKKIIDDLSKTTRDQLDRGIKIIRIQTYGSATDYWIDAYKKLLEDYPEKYKMYLDEDHSDLINIALIDPNGDNPIVQLLFEVEQTT